MAKHRSAQQWASIIQRYESSDLTQPVFCKRHGIALSTLTYHLRRHRAQQNGSSRGATVPELVELKLPAGQSPAPACTLGCGVRIELSTPGDIAVSIHCQSTQVGEILAQIPNLLPLSP